MFRSKISTRTALRLLPLLFLLSMIGCSEYWWQRGQPPSVDTLLVRSSENLKQAEEKFAAKRADVLSSFRELDTTLDKVVDLARKSADQSTVAPALETLSLNFIGLEGKLSIGSRAALGELSGQLRSFVEDSAQKKHLPFPAVGLFAARTKNFLASELSVPPPVL